MAKNNVVLLFLSRFVRLFSYGSISVVLYLFLVELGFDVVQVGILLTLTLAGDMVMTLYLTVTADAFGRKKTLIVGALLKIFAGVTFATQTNYMVLVFAAVVGVITPTGGEIGPFLTVEQSSLTQLLSKDSITNVFAYYNLVGYLAQAIGALSAGFVVTYCFSIGYSAVHAYRLIIIGYGLFGFLMLVIYMLLSDEIEAQPVHVLASTKHVDWGARYGLHRAESRRIVFKLSLLFIIDSFAGGFVIQTLIVYYFHQRYGTSEDGLGTLLMGANVLSGLSALVAAPMVTRFGAINTMVFTHLPSNIFLILVVCMPNEDWAIAMLMLRFAISQMDVPARQTYVAMVVDADERSAAGGITSIVRSVGLFLAPTCTGYLMASPPTSLLFASPFIISGSLKIVYDLLLYTSFQCTPDASSGSSSSASSTASSTSINSGGGNAPNKGSRFPEATEHSSLIHKNNEHNHGSVEDQDDV